MCTARVGLARRDAPSDAFVRVCARTGGPGRRARASKRGGSARVRTGQGARRWRARAGAPSSCCGRARAREGEAGQGRPGGAREQRGRRGQARGVGGRREGGRGEEREKEKEERKWGKEKKKEGRELKRERERGGERVGADRGRGRPRVVPVARDAQAEGPTGMEQREIWISARFLGVSGDQAGDDPRRGSSSTTKQNFSA